MKCLIVTIALTLLIFCVQASAQSEQKFAELGDFKLESGEVIRDCRIGYRTFGALNADKSNAILFPTWFTGKSEQIAGTIGKGRMVDDTRFFVIAVDAIGNGVSSSPSNSRLQPSDKFPRFTIRDMVNAEHQLVTRALGIKKLYAVMGISMGGMQTFEWIVAYPEMMERAVPIVGTTHQTAYDLLLWSTELRSIEEAKKRGDGDAAMPLVGRIHALALFTPSYRNRATNPAEFQNFIENEEKNYLKNFKADDWAAQLRAMMTHDVAKTFKGSMTQAAWAVKAKVLVVVARQDMMVNPDPAIDFARLIKAETLEVNSDCGHVFAGCDGAAVNAIVARFLNQ